MAVVNEDVANMFDEIADLLEIEGSNPFRIRAYRNAARIIRDLPQDIAIISRRGDDLTSLPGIGKDLAAKIEEIVRTGKCAMLNRLRKRLPATVTDLLHIPGLGPKRVRILYHELDIHNLEQLHRAAKDGRLRSLPGFGEKTETRILQVIEAHASSVHRFKLSIAGQHLQSLLNHLKTCRDIKRLEVAGSFRRCQETVGDLDVLATSDHPEKVMDHFVAFDEIGEVLSRGSTRSSVILKCGIQVDLRVVPEESFGAAMHYFTGSRSHNIAIRRIGQNMGLKINEYGVFKKGRRIAGQTEQSVYESVGLPFIPPELRENRGEIEAAKAGLLPELVELSDLRGDLHVHTRATDGYNSMEEMAMAAIKQGLTYLAITEHSRRLTVAHGLNSSRLLQQMEAIDELNAGIPDITLLKGIEVEILEDGRLDLPDGILGKLDLVIGAVHSHFGLSRQKQTERILRAMDHVCFTILAHPSGRLIERREPYDVDMLKIIRHARTRGCYLELNAHPDRLDLLDTYCQYAKEEGVLICINSDAHSTFDFRNLIYGVGQARRGWLSKEDVLNTRELDELKPLLKRTMLPAS